MKPSAPKSAYAAAGVDIDAQEVGLARVKKLAKSTFTPGVLTEIGSFGGLEEIHGPTFELIVLSWLGDLTRQARDAGEIVELEDFGFRDAAKDGSIADLVAA